MKEGFGQRLLRLLLIFGPGIFCVGYTIGTGSVTTMIQTGSTYGLRYLWVVALSCLFCGFLMEAYGRFALVTGKTTIQAFREHFGKPVAWLVLGMVVLGQWCCLSGLVGLSSEAIYQLLRMYFPGLESVDRYVFVLGTAACVMLAVYILLWFGNYSRLEKILVLLVTFLGLSFIVSNFMVPPHFSQVMKGLLPCNIQGAELLVASLVGTTLAAPTFVVRPLLLRGKGWTKTDLKLQTRDVCFSAFLMFLVSGSIMCCATGAIYNHGGKPIEQVMDMVETLRPLAGSGAVLIFLIGLISAGLSSIFPIVMVAPLLIGDYRDGELEVQTPTFRILAAFVCCIGLTVPILGANPIFAQILTQVAQVFVLPLVIALMMVLINRRTLMGEHRAGVVLNLGLFLAFCFSLVISYQGIQALKQIFS